MEVIPYIVSIIRLKLHFLKRLTLRKNIKNIFNKVKQSIRLEFKLGCILFTIVPAQPTITTNSANLIIFITPGYSFHILLRIGC